MGWGEANEEEKKEILGRIKCRENGR